MHNIEQTLLHIFTFSPQKVNSQEFAPFYIGIDDAGYVYLSRTDPENNLPYPIFKRRSALDFRGKSWFLKDCISKNFENMELGYEITLPRGQVGVYSGVQLISVEIDTIIKPYSQTVLI